MDTEQFNQSILQRLVNDDISALESFNKLLKSDLDKYQKIDFAHEFIDQLTFKLRQSKSKMDKKVLADYLFDTINNTSHEFDYSPKFVALQFKALITYYKMRKKYDKAIRVLEFLIQKGITDDESQKFHIQLDEMFRMNQKYQKKLQRNSLKNTQ